MSEYEWGIRYEVKMLDGEWYVTHIESQCCEAAVQDLANMKIADPRVYRNAQLVRRPIAEWEVVDDD